MSQQKPIRLLALASLGAILVLVVFTFGLSAFLRSRSAPGTDCVKNLRTIEEATHYWANKNQKGSQERPFWEDIRPYLPGGRLLSCPQGGTYTIGAVGGSPGCSYPGHRLPGAE